MADTIATLGIRVTSSGVKEAATDLEKVSKSSNEVSKSSDKAQKAIDKMIESLRTQSIVAEKGVNFFQQYKLASLGATDSEKKYARALQGSIDAHKKIAQEQKEAIKTQQSLDSANAKRQRTIDQTIKSLKEEEIKLKSGKSGLTEYRLSLLGASEAEKKEAQELHKRIKALQDANSATDKHGDALKALISSLSALGAAYFGFQALKGFASDLLETAKIADSYKYSLQAVSDSNEEAAETFEYLTKESERLGLSLISQEKAFTGFAAAAKQSGMKVEETRSVYTGLMEAMTAIHRTPEEASQALKAFQDMLSKGTIQAEELKKQLGNALPGAMSYMADATGKTTQELMKMMEKGILPAKEGVKILSDYLSNKFQLAAENASNSVQGSINKMENAWYELKKAIVDAMGDNTTGIIKDVTEELKRMTKLLSDPNVQQDIKDIAEALKFLTEKALQASSAIASIIIGIKNFDPLDFAGITKEQDMLTLGAIAAKKGLVDYNEYAKASNAERNRMVDEGIKKQEEYTYSFIDSAKHSKTASDQATENIKRITDAQVQVNKETFLGAGVSAEQAKQIQKITDKIKEKASEAGKTSIQIQADQLRELGMAEPLVQAQIKIMEATEAKNNAVKEGIKASKDAESQEEKRVKFIEDYIANLEQEANTYKKGKEYTAEYILGLKDATEAQKQRAMSAAAVIDAAKSEEYWENKRAKQLEEYGNLIEKITPKVEQSELKRQQAIELTAKIYDEKLNAALGNTIESFRILDEKQSKLSSIDEYFNNEELNNFENSLKDVKEEINSFNGSSFGNEIADGINNAILSMRSLNDYLEKQSSIEEELNKKREEAQKLVGEDERKKALKEVNDLETKNIANQLSGYRQLFGTTSQLFKENSRERKALHTLEMAFAAAEIAINLQKTISAAYTAIAYQGTGDPYTAFARVAAMTALMGGIVAAAGGSLSGGSGSGNVSAGSSVSAGTVLGGSEGERSQSVNNTLEYLQDIEAKQYNELRGINTGVEDLNRNITGLVTSIVRTGSAEGFVSVAGTTGGTSFVQDIGAKGLTAASNLSSLGTIAITDTVASITRNIPILGNITNGISDWLDDTISDVSGALFGGKETTSIIAQGLELSTAKISDLLNGMEIDIKKFADIRIKKDGGLFGSDKTYYKTLYEAIGDDSIKLLFTNVFESMGKTMVEISKSLGLGEGNLKQILEYSFDVGKLDLKGMDAEEINKAVSAAISESGDQAVQALFGSLISQYQKVGEGLLETAVRVASEKTAILDILETTGVNMIGLSIPEISIKITQSLADLAGGLKNLQDAFSTYYDKFFSDAEKQVRLQEQLTGAFASMGEVLPTTREEFKKLVSAQAIYTEEGQKNYLTLLGLSEAADQYYKTLETEAENASKKILDIENKKASLLLRIDELTLSSAEYTAKTRQAELAAIDESLRPLQERIYALQDEAAANKEATDLLKKQSDERIATLKAEAAERESIQNKKFDLEIQILKLTGKETEATALLRQKELKAMDESLRPLQETIWELEDLKNVVNVDYKEIAETQKQNIKNIVEDGVKTFNYLIKSAESYGGLVVNLDDKSKDLIQSLNDFQHAISATLGAASMYKDAILESIEAIQPEKIFESIFETTNTPNVLDPINKFVLDIKDRISVFGEVVDEAGKGVDDYLSSVGDINKQYMEAQDALNKSVYLTADEQSKVAESFKYTVYALAQTSSEIEEVRSSFASKLNMKNALSETLSIFEETIIKKAGENISPVIELNISKDIFAGLVSSGAIDKVAASIAGVTEGNASEFQSAYSQLIKLLTQGTITTEEFNSVFNVTKDIFTGAIKPMQTVTEDLEKRFALEMEILRLTGKETEAIKLEREKELATLGDTLKPLQERVWLLQDEKTASELAAKNAADLLEAQKQAEEEKKKILEDNLSFAEEALKKSTEKQIDFYKTLVDEANRIFEESRTMLDRSFAAEQASITKQHEMLISGLTSRLEEAQSAASDLESVFNSLSDARKSMELDSGGITYKAVQKQLSDAISMAKSGDISGAKGLVPNLRILTSQGAEKYGSQEEFKRDFFKTYNALSELEGLTGTQLTEQQQMVKALETQIEQANINNQNTLNSLQAQYDAVTGVNKSVISFQDAIVQFQKAQYEADGANTLLKTQTEVLNNQLNVLLGIDTSILSLSAAINALVAAQAAVSSLSQSNIPSFASGGVHYGGLRIVGENGPELEYTPPAQITSNNDLKSIMSNEEVVAELRSLRAELARANFELVKNTADSSKTLKKFDYDGMPETRTA